MRKIEQGNLVDSPPDVDTTVNVLWYGAATNEFGWVIDRIASVGFITQSSNVDDLLNRLAIGTVDRVVLAHENRFSFPDDLLSLLAVQYPEIPLAICLGDYWLGWKRTGAGHLQALHHCNMPWYRWHDGWLPWLKGADPNLLGPFPADRFHLQSCSIFQWQDSSKGDGRTLLFCMEHSVAQAWQAAYRGQSDCLTVVSQKEIESCCDLNQAAPQVNLIWDDSRLATWNGVEFAVDQAIAELRKIAAKFPEQTIWICWTHPNWHIWQRIMATGICCELLGKPQLLSFSSAALART